MSSKVKTDQQTKTHRPTDGELVQLEHLLAEIATDLNSVCRTIPPLESSLEENERQIAMYCLESALEKVGCLADFAYGLVTGKREPYARGGIEEWFMHPVYFRDKQNALKAEEGS